MMTISCSDSLVEFTLTSERRVSVERRGLSAVTMRAERLACGRIGHALLLVGTREHDPVRVEGDAIEIGALHQYFLDLMMGDAVHGQSCAG